MIKRKGDWEFEFEWKDVWELLAVLTAAAFAVFLLMFLFSHKVVEGYSLDQKSGNGVLYIEKHVDWAVDGSVELERSITVQQALKIVDSLNASLPRK